MPRNDPPPQPRRRYITPEGAQRLRDELGDLWRRKRPEVTAAVADAAALGDRSENAEYIYGKKQLREIDRRIRFLHKRLEELVIVDRTPADTERVYFGAWVELEDENGATMVYRIVGADESDAARGLISIDAPLARALLRKRIDDEVVVMRPEGHAVFTIVGVRYEDPA